MRFIIEHLEKHFDKKEVLKDIDFTFEAGNSTGVWGATARERPRCLTVSTGTSRRTAEASFWKKTEHAGK